MIPGLMGQSAAANDLGLGGELMNQMKEQDAERRKKLLKLDASAGDTLGNMSPAVLSLFSNG